MIFLFLLRSWLDDDLLLCNKLEDYRNMDRERIADSQEKMILGERGEFFRFLQSGISAQRDT